MKRSDLKLGDFHCSALLIQADLKEYNIKQLTDKFFSIKDILCIRCPYSMGKSTISYKILNCNLRLIRVVIKKRQEK